MPRAHFSWRTQYFVDLDKKVAEKENVVCDISNVHLLLCAQNVL